MAKGSLRRYDVQAKWALNLAIVGGLGALALLGLLYRNFKPDLSSIVFSASSKFALAVYGVTALTLLVAATACAMGANSAGQRRNELTRRSWAAFFVSAATLSLTFILFFAFRELRFVVQ